MRTIEPFRNSASDSIHPAAYVNGFTDGQAARASNSSLSAYVRVGIDDYAKGYRAGYFSRGQVAAVADRPVGRQVVNL